MTPRTCALTEAPSYFVEPVKLQRSDQPLWAILGRLGRVAVGDVETYGEQTLQLLLDGVEVRVTVAEALAVGL